MNKPFLLRPAGKDYLWGGRRLNDEFEKGIDMTPLAETWECSTHPDGPSTADSGEFADMTLKEILAARPEFLGERYAKAGELPVLIKFIDAKSDLSVQVHPDDVFAAEHENGQSGKSELWYVLDAAADSKLIYGFHHDTDEAELKKALKDGKLMNHLRRIPVKKDDLFFIEAGTVHAVGAGVLLAEIQENSNLTYRLYDYDRVDKDGEKRPLHIDKALACACMKRSSDPRQPLRVLRYRQGAAAELLCRCRHFEVYRLIVNTERKQQVVYESDHTSFRVLLCIGGCGTLRFAGEDLFFSKGDCIFVPADSEKIRIHGQASFLEVRG